MFLYDVCKLLSENKVSYAVVGGHAVALHGAVRGTLDIDIVIKWTLKNLQKTEQILNTYGLVSRLPLTAGDIYQFRDEYIRNKNLTAWNFYHPQQLNKQVDIIISYDLTGKKTKSVKISGGVIKILSLNDLIKMKQRAGREQDYLDVEALQKIHKSQ